MGYEKNIEKAKNIADIFEIVKDIVLEYLGLDQAGLMVGISDLGAFERGFIGAFYSLNSNMIIINKRPLARILQTDPSLYKYYLFHVILHEYIHSIGSYDEAMTRQLVYEISGHYFGQNHIVTQLASNIERFMPNLAYPVNGFQPPQDINIEFVKGIDRKNIGYIG
jgi:predicted Zn-dependent protease with MMP-like domain